MQVPIVLPELGAEQHPLAISTWLVGMGETVLQGDRIVEIALPGMTFDVASSVSGKLVRIEKQAGDKVATGDVLGHYWIEEESRAT